MHFKAPSGLLLTLCCVSPSSLANGKKQHAEPGFSISCIHLLVSLTSAHAHFALSLAGVRVSGAGEQGEEKEQEEVKDEEQEEEETTLIWD